MSAAVRWSIIGFAFALTYAIGRRLFVAVMRDADPARQALGRGRLYDAFLTDYGHLLFGACVAVSLADGGLGGSRYLRPWVRDVAGCAFPGWCALLLWVDAKLGRLFRVPQSAVSPNGAAPSTDRKLLTDGPYALVRHPRYLCWMGLLASVALAAGSLVGLFAAAGFLLLVLRRIGREERFLRAQLGAPYAAYATRTARLVPWVY